MAYISEGKQVLIDSIRLSDFAELRISRIENKSGEFESVDIRQWYCTQSNPEMKPTQKGVRIRAEQLDSVLSAIHTARG